jgi:alpha-ribazole phosphatase CobZ
MELENKISGVQAEVRDGCLVVSFDRPLRTLSSGILNGGLAQATGVFNLQVPPNYDHSDPEGYLREAAERLSIPTGHVGMMTAALVEKAVAMSRQSEGLTITVLVTAGITNSSAAGHYIGGKNPQAGTINIIVLVDRQLTDACLVNLVKTATEAKSMALRELDIRDRLSYRPATGTTSDAICIACTDRGKALEYGGTATEVGQLTGSLVRESVREAIRNQHGLTPERSLVLRLAERGLGLECLVETCLEMFVPHPGVEDRAKATAMLTRGLEKALSDPNVASLVTAGLRLQEDGEIGLVPGLPKESFEKDPIYLVADELLGMALADYIAGARGLFEFIRFDRKKPGILRELGPILDDVVGGLLAGVSSNMYTLSG